MDTTTYVAGVIVGRHQCFVSRFKLGYGLIMQNDSRLTAIFWHILFIIPEWSSDFSRGQLRVIG